MLQSEAMAAEQTASASQLCPRCGAKIDTSAVEPLARIECPQCGEKFRVERTFNNFVILETLGVGGMGTVYKARDTLLDRHVALKLLRDDLGDEFDHAARLQQEARVAASVNHPNVVQVFSSGTDHGKFYLVMELVDRGSLDDLIEEQKRLPEELVLATGIQVAKGLRAAYGKGLIHRDVKPANILFADEHTAKIGDFGLAGVAAQKAEDRGEIWGTPYYVAPERLKNEAEDFRSDIYSLGATLFHAFSGTAPIAGETNSALELLKLKRHPVDLMRVAPDVSHETAQIFQRMIAPDPAKRFGSYDELVKALERAYGMLTGDEEFLGKQRRRRLRVGLVILAVTLVAVGAWALLNRKRAEQTVNAIKAQTEQLIALAPLESRMAEARRDLVQLHYQQAKSKFAQVALDAKGRQPLYDWAQFQLALAALAAREPSQAQQVCNDVANAGERNFANEDVDLAKFFVNTAKTLTSRESVPKNFESTGPNSFAMLLFALKQINDRNIAEAIPLLEQFVNAQPQGKFAWVAEYRPFAQKYLDDCRSYADWKNGGEIGTNAQARLEKLKQIKLKVQHSAIADEIDAERNRLATEVASKQKADTSAREQEQKKRAQDFAQKKSQWLAQWKRTLIDDLNRAHYSGAIVDLAGVPYTGITSATEQTVKMKLPYGEAEIPWAKLPPQTQLAVSQSFASASADRQWLCAVYANETGQTDAAKKLAEAAAQSKPEYRERMTMLFAR
ncbi:MAG: eukaryotic-like serine/threonine-protein kinase [Verrucomicrobiota bacterium]|jgi:serine/threonine protein kinase